MSRYEWALCQHKDGCKTSPHFPKYVEMLSCSVVSHCHTCRNTVSDSGLWLDGHIALTNVESGLSPGTF